MFFSKILTFVFFAILLAFSSESFAKTHSCRIYFDASNGRGSESFEADSEWDAKAQFEKKYPDKKILNIVCTKK